MFSLNGPCFLLVPNDQNQRLLLPGKVCEMRAGRLVVQFDDAIAFNPGDQAVVLAEWRQKFLQQSVVIDRFWNAPPTAEIQDPAVTESETEQPELPAIVAEARPQAPVVEFTPSGQPISADQRGSYRVSVAASDLYAQVGSQRDCQVMDVSPEGLAVISDGLQIGSRVNVSFAQGGVEIQGTMVVQTCKELRSGRLRFGLCAHDKKAPIRGELQKLSMRMQRDQLKRLAGAA